MNKSEQVRLWAWRVRVIREAASSPRNIARTCRHFGISRQAYYRWKRRFDAQGEAGLWDQHESPESITDRHAARGAGQDSLPAAALPFWSGQDCGLPPAIPSAAADSVVRASNSAPTRNEPLAEQPETSRTRQALATLREAATGLPAAAGRQVSAT